MEQLTKVGTSQRTKQLTAAKRSIWHAIVQQKYAHLFVLTGMLIVFIFHYLPMFGILMAFKNYSISTGIKGIFTSEWVGLKYFNEFVHAYNFKQIVTNTLAISLLKLVFTFPMPILLAIMFNEVRYQFFKRFAQTVSYFPHFISWIVVSGLLVVFLSTNNGIVNDLLKGLGLVKDSLPFLSSPDYFWGLAVTTAMWKEAGWWAIIFLAAISGLDPTLYDAAEMDGAGRLRRIWHITLPGIRGTIIVVLILAVGSMLGGGLVGSNFEQSYLLGNSINNERSEILQTYAFKMGLAQGRYAYATAIDLIQSVIAIILVFGSNYLSKKVTKNSLF
ncbi:ABC transporter permease [Paenibacillus oryzisoli]|uniref:Protein lplB n=1 Tax=Paenibacillus oryzisoli TaxID=1850517 RepID=A0A198A007_9BACL|nr:ABC transporter permease subunit [Paenibacillus oryzisoli]OAS14356.1 protein lplB [Paenibacillus oryzisoli]